MQVVNRKERTNAKWRFAGLYLVSLAVPVFLLLNGIEMGKVDQQEESRLVEQLRKRDQALAEVSQLAVVLNEAQKLKPAFVNEPIDPAKYDQLRYSFEQGVERMKKQYYGDTSLYGANYQILSLLENSYKNHNRLSGEFTAKLNEELARAAPSARGESGGGNGGGGGGNQAQLIILERELKTAERTIARLEAQIQNRPSPGLNNGEIQRLREHAIAVEANIEQIATVLSGIEEDCNGIQRRGDNNLRMKNKIIERVRFLKNHIAGIRNTNNNLMGMNDNG